jgi:hypothetical protein
MPSFLFALSLTAKILEPSWYLLLFALPRSAHFRSRFPRPRAMQFVVVGVAASLLSAAIRVDAFETCSDADNQVLLDLYSAGAMTDACAPYADFMPIGTAAVYWPCEATDCNAIMAQVASDMPDCWYRGSNQKETLQEAVDRCNGDTPDWLIGSEATASSESSEEFYPDWSTASSADDEGMSAESATGSEWSPYTFAPSEDGISTASPDADTTDAPAQDSNSTASTFTGAAWCLSSISLLIAFM